MGIINHVTTGIDWASPCMSLQDLRPSGVQSSWNVACWDFLASHVWLPEAIPRFCTNPKPNKLSAAYHPGFMATDLARWLSCTQKTRSLSWKRSPGRKSSGHWQTSPLCQICTCSTFLWFLIPIPQTSSQLHDHLLLQRPHLRHSLLSKTNCSAALICKLLNTWCCPRILGLSFCIPLIH